jgi:DNA-binding NarL/FixJ family response regulator
LRAVLHEALAVPGISTVTREMILIQIAWESLCSVGRNLESISLLDGELRATPAPAEHLPALVGELAWEKRLAGMPEEPLLQQAVDVARAIMADQERVPRQMIQLPLGTAGAIAVFDDRHADAVGLLRDASHAAARAGELEYVAFHNGLLALREGRLADAHRAIEAALEWGGPSCIGYARVALVDIWRGNHRAAADAVKSARRLLHEGNTGRAMEIDFAAGFEALLRRDYAAAWPPLHAAAELMEHTHYREPSHPPVLPAAVEAAVALGEIEQALVLCAHLERNADLLASRFGAAAARRCRGAIAQALGRLADAEACYRQGADGFAAIQVPLERARTLLALGSLQRRAGQRRLARATLQTARGIFANCGAVGLAADAEGELRRIGGRTASSGIELTAAEAQVAECVARGLTNADVAQVLHLSVKTVETHLGRAYRKLGVTNRVRLALALDGRAETEADAAGSGARPVNGGPRHRG